MTLNEFITKYDGKGIDVDGFPKDNPYQCMDVYRAYAKEVLRFPQSPPVVGAKDVWDTYLTTHYTRLDNTPEAVPQTGDIIIWGSGYGKYGHIAICTSANINTFSCFSQNDPAATLCRVRRYNSYKNVLGWLRPTDIMDDMPQWLTTLLKEDLKLDISLPEGDIRARVGELKDAINTNESFRKRIHQLEEDYSVVSGELEETKERLRLSDESRSRLENEIKTTKEMVISRDTRITALEQKIETLEKILDPEKNIVITTQEYNRLREKAVIDRFTKWELFKALIGIGRK